MRGVDAGAGEAHRYASLGRTRSVFSPPSRFLLALEGRAGLEMASCAAAWPLLLRGLRSGDDHPVLVMPGFIGGDLTTGFLRRFLDRLGYRSHGWGLGMNLGPGTEVVRGLVDRLRSIVDRSGRKVTLVGWSLGGVYGYELARRYSENVRALARSETARPTWWRPASTRFWVPRRWSTVLPAPRPRPSLRPRSSAGRTRSSPGRRASPARPAGARVSRFRRATAAWATTPRPSGSSGTGWPSARGNGGPSIPTGRRRASSASAEAPRPEARKEKGPAV
jgi:pimeloyl-ACP methyl ester carboxylesterase